MGICVCNGANIMCTFGTSPASLLVNSNTTVLTSNMPAATIMDYKPMANIMPFGMCNSVLNPATKRPPPVLFTPAPCIPNTVSPWVVGSPTVLTGNLPTLNNSSVLTCIWGGVISINNPGQTTVMIP